MVRVSISSMWINIKKEKSEVGLGLVSLNKNNWKRLFSFAEKWKSTVPTATVRNALQPISGIWVV